MLSRANLFAVILAMVAVCAAAPSSKAYSNVSGDDWTPDTGVAVLDDLLNQVESTLKGVFSLITFLPGVDGILESIGGGITSIVSFLASIFIFNMFSV